MREAKQPVVELPGLPVLLSVCGLLSNSLLQVYALCRLAGFFYMIKWSSWETYHPPDSQTKLHKSMDIIDSCPVSGTCLTEGIGRGLCSTQVICPNSQLLRPDRGLVFPWLWVLTGTYGWLGTSFYSVEWMENQMQFSPLLWYLIETSDLFVVLRWVSLGINFVWLLSSLLFPWFMNFAGLASAAMQSLTNDRSHVIFVLSQRIWT